MTQFVQCQDSKAKTLVNISIYNSYLNYERVKKNWSFKVINVKVKVVNAEKSN